MKNPNRIKDKKAYSSMLRQWEYCYCKSCEAVRYNFELEATPHGIKCLNCSSFDLDPPAWIECPHRKGAVKCVAGGSGLVQDKTGYKCVDRCRFLFG
jgi:hypothetical protein